MSAKHLLSIAALIGASLAHAAPVDLGLASPYGLVSFGDFRSGNNSIAGSVAVAGNLTASGFALNGSQLVVGGDLSYRNGSIAGDAYVGGTRSTEGVGFSGQWLDGSAPLAFAGLAHDMQTLASGLASVAATGSSTSQWGGLYLSGTQSAVEVFSLGAADLSGNGWSNLSGLAAGSTVIFNIGGSDVRLSNGMLGGLGQYNVLLNFYEAQTLTLNGIGLEASILAPSATVLGANGSIGGTVVAGNWNASVTLNGRNGFRSTEVAGYVLPTPLEPTRDQVALDPTLDRSNPGAPVTAEVPEPGQLSLMVLALGAMALVAKRRRRLRI